MMDKNLTALFNIFKKKGIFNTEEEFLSLINKEGVGVLYPSMPEGMFGSEEEFIGVFQPSLKKKDDSQFISPEQPLESDTPMDQVPGSSDGSPIDEGVLEGDVEQVIGQVPDEFGGGDITRFEAGRRRRGQQGAIEESDRDIAAENRKRRDEGLPPIMTGEKDTWLERTVGKYEVTDFFGDLWRAGAKGYETGNTIDEALELSFKGRSASDQDIADFIRVNDSLNQTGPSDEMKAFNKAYSAAGGGAWGFIKGIIAAPTSVTEIAVTSVAQMVNPAVAAGAATGAGAGAAIGSTGFSAGPLGVFTTAGGAIAGALGGAGATLEAGLSFSEFLQEELAEKGLAFDQEGVRKVLEDEEAMFRIRTRSAGRGAAIGIIDGFTAGFASKIAKGVGQTAIKAGKTAKRANLAATAAATGIEGLGGGVGEAAARALVGQEMDAAEIGFEIVGGAPGSAITMLRNTAGRGKYTMGPDEAPVTFEEMVKIIEETDDATFAGMKLRIKGDEVLKGMAEDRKDALKQKQAKVEQLGEDLDNLSVEDAEAAIELETELDKVSGGLTRAKKNRKKEIETQLDEIYSRRQEPAVEAVVEVTEAEVFNEIGRRAEEDGRSGDITTSEEIESVRQELLKQKQDAIQESSTTDVDVQEQTEDGQPMGDGDSEGGVTVEGEGETEGATEATQEEIEQGAQDLGDLLSGLTEGDGDLGDGTRGRNVDDEIEVVSGIDAEGNPVTAPPQPGVEVSENLTVVDQTETDSHYGSEVFRRENPNVTPQQHETMLMERVDKALKSVKKLFPKVKIVMHRSEASYKSIVGTGSRGAFDPNTNTIHINMPKATGRTIGHEVFHAILKDRFGSEVNIQTATKALIKSLRAGINKSTNLTAEQVLELERYAQIFDGDKAIVQDEEFLAEFVGFLSETYSKLEVPQQTAIKQWLAKIGKLLGFTPEEVLAQTDRDVVDLLNTIAGKVTEGQEITETDVAMLGTEERAQAEVEAKFTERQVLEPKAKAVIQKVKDFVSKLKEKRITLSQIRKKFGLNYKEGGQVLDQLEDDGVIEPFDGGVGREIIDKPAPVRKPVAREAESNEVVLAKKGNLTLIKNNKTKEDIIQTEGGAKLIRGIDTNGETYFEVEGDLNQLKTLGFNPNNFAFDEGKIQSVIDGLIDSKPAPVRKPAPAPQVESKPVVSETAIDPKNVVQNNSNDKPGARDAEQAARTSPSLQGKNINDLVGKKFTFEITPSHEVLREDMGEKKFMEVMVQDLPGTKWGVGFTVLKGDFLGGEYKSVNNNELFSRFIKKLNEAHTVDTGMGGIVPQNIASAINALQKNDPNFYDYGRKPGTEKESFAPSKALSNLNSGPGGMLIKLVESDGVKTQAVTEVEGGQKVSKPSSALKTQAIGAFEVSYTQQEKVAQMIKEGLITEPDDVSFLKGKDTIITSPDDMLVGEISLNGKPIFEGGGGVFFVTKYGEVWAAGKKATAEQIARGINRGVKDNGGKGYLTLTKGADKKLVSSASGVNSTLAILDSMLDEGLVSPSNFRAAVSSAVKKAGGEIDLRGSSKKLKADVNEYFSDPSTTTFEKRGSVVEAIVGEIAKSLPKELRPKVVQFLGGNPNKSVGATKTPKSHSLVDLVAGVAAEKLTKGLKTGDVYAVIEVDGEVEVVKGDHKSYPWHVKLKDGGKPILHLPKNREAGGKVLVPKSGKPYSVGQANVVNGTFQGQTEGIKTQAIPPIKQTKREFVARIEAALQGEGSFAHMTAENPANKTMSAKENAVRNKELEAELEARGYDAVKIGGKYGRPEKSFFVPDISEADAIEIGKKYGQESVAHSKGMLYTTGKDKGKRNPITGEVEVNNKLEDYYSEIQTKGGKVKYSVGYNFGVLTDDAPIKTQAMTAPNGKPSNLTPEQQELVNTPAFKKWFGDSKIVDENGEPKVVSHFTDKEFDVFKYKESGFHFGDASIQEDLEIAKDKDFPIELEVFLNIRNPLRIEDSHRFDPSVLIKQLVKNDIITEAKADELENTFYEIEENLTEDEYEDSNALVTKQSDVLIKELQDLGYDGMVYENRFDSQDSKLSYLLDEELSKIYIRNEEGVFVGDIIPESESKTRQFLTFDSKSGETYVFKSNDGDPISSANKKRIKKLLDDGDVVSTVNSPKEHSDFDLFTGPKDFKDSFVAFEPNQIKLADGTNKTFSPDSDSIKTQVFNPTNTTEDIIKFGRENNFSDASIKDYLVRVKKEKVKEVNKMMAIDADMFRQMPVSFGNIEGGARVGVKLFARVEKFMEKLNAKNNKRKEDDRLSEREIMDQTIEFLEKQPAYIAEGGKRKAETDQQTQMIIEMQKALGVNPTKGMNTRIREMRQKMVERRRGGMDLQAVKRDLRNFIRQALPTVKGSTYSKSELMTLLGKVAKADKKNIANLMDEVVDIVTKRQVKALDAKIESILNGKYEVVQSGRLKGVKIDNETRERLERIKDAVTDEAMTAEDIVAANLTLNEEFTKLNEKPDQTEQDLNRMADLMVVMSLNNSKLMDDTSIDKVESLNTAEDILLQIVGEGKETFKEQLRADHERYQDQFVKVYKDVTGETIDLSNPEVKDESKKAARKQARAQKARDAEKGLVKYLRKFNRKIKSFLKSSESIEGLMHIIAEAPGAIFGGNARKLVYEKLSAAERVYKARMMEASTFIQSKVKEVYGKDWKKISRGNSVRTQTGVYVDPAAVKKAQEKYDANKTFGNKKALEQVKREEMVSLSPNEIGYLWQQYQDPANLPSFANEENVNFGTDHARIMSELVESIGGEDGKIIELAKWQVEEAYPSMYAHINEAYKKIYRTNMPWNKFYAGMLKREGREIQPLDMLASKEAFNNQVGGASTKMRIKNSRPIEPRDMMGALVTYTTDMEWFAAMGPTVRDINKLFGNPMMRKAIINVTGESTMRLIDHHIKNIAARGINTESGQDFVNAMNNMFATTRLGFSPNIAIKQLTSIPTYATDIGWGNYVFHAVKNKAEFIKVLNEIRNNSVYMQDRLSSDIRKVTESYSANQDVEFVPKSASSYFVNMMMGFIKAGDITAIYLGGMPNYSFYKSEFMKANPNATEQEAIDHAIVKFELDTKSTQQSMDLTDKDFYQSSGAFARALNLFKTSQKQYLRKEFAGMRNLRRGFRDKNFKQILDGGNKVLMYHFMMPMLFQYIASGLPGLMTGWDDEDTEDMIRAGVLGNFNALFAVGDIIKGTADAVQGKPWADKVGSIPVFEVFADINKNYMEWQETKDPVKKQEAFEKMMARIAEVATLGKIPFANLNRMYKNIEKASKATDSKEVVLRLLNYSDYVIEGGESDTKSAPKTREERDAQRDGVVDKKKKEEEKRRKNRDRR